MGDESGIEQYDSKYKNYDIGQRLSDLESIVRLQCSKGNYDVDDYMRGMANGLLLAWNIIREPYGKEIKYFGRPDQLKELGVKNG